MQVQFTTDILVDLLNFAPVEHYSFSEATKLVGGTLSSKACLSGESSQM